MEGGRDGGYRLAIQSGAVDSHFQELADAFRSRLHGLSSERCQIHPPGGDHAWSTHNVIEHLVLTYRNTIVQVEKYRRRGSASSRKPTLREIAQRTVVVAFGHFPRGVPAPEFVFPGKQAIPAMGGSTLAKVFEEELGRMDAELDACERLFRAQKFAAHFRLGPLSAQQWRKFHLVHGRHHLAQADRIERQIRSNHQASTKKS